jgi:hypothetical protein
MEPLNLKTHHVASYNPDVSIWVVDGKLQARSEFLETECAEECVTGSKRLYQSIGLTDAEIADRWNERIENFINQRTSK